MILLPEMLLMASVVVGASAPALISLKTDDKMKTDDRTSAAKARGDHEPGLPTVTQRTGLASVPGLRIDVARLVANDIKRFSHTIRVSLGRAFASVGRSLGVANASAAFYPYSELKHTWKCHAGRICFKISDYMTDAPEEVLESLAWYLLSRAIGKKCPDEKAYRYGVYAHSEELWESKKELYLERSKNLSFEPRGDARDLREVFDYVNSFYFSSKIRNPVLAWARESPRRRLGFYFAPLNLLAANRALDSERVPRYVLEFVVFHELLHHMSAGDGRESRRVHHTVEFRRQERTFSHHNDAERWLREIVAKNRSTRD